MTKPVRIQLRRTKGWHMPENTVRVSRPSKWGNPYKWTDGVEIGGEAWARGWAADFYRQWMLEPIQADLRAAAQRELRGKNLACFCPLDQACHADVLLELANA